MAGAATDMERAGLENAIDPLPTYVEMSCRYAEFRQRRFSLPLHLPAAGVLPAVRLAPAVLHKYAVLAACFQASGSGTPRNSRPL
jgi:hypothetical protein